VAQHKSAEKSVRQDAKARLRNRGWKSKIKTARRRLEAALESGETGNLAELFREYASTVDRATAKGVLHKTTAARRKHSMARKLKAAGVSGKKAPQVKPSKNEAEENEEAPSENQSESTDTEQDS
jgi:small subunit ribosomal protein S20